MLIKQRLIKFMSQKFGIGIIFSRLADHFLRTNEACMWEGLDLVFIVFLTKSIKSFFIFATGVLIISTIIRKKNNFY